MESASRTPVPVLIEQVEKEIEATRRTLDILQAQLSILRKADYTAPSRSKASKQQMQPKPPKAGKAALVVSNPPTKSVTILSAGLEGMKTLGQFTRPELEAWVRSKYPHLKFTRKSLDKPVRAAILKGQAQVTQQNTGNRSHAHYKWLDLAA